MSDWREPITDRTAADIETLDAASLEYRKGALNADDLNRIEGNYRYILEHLETDAIFIPHSYRNREETTIEIVDVTTEYTPVEYIQSSGTQYIDTGFKHNQNTRIVMDVQAVAINANAWLFEGRNSTSSARHGLFFYYTSGSLWNSDYSGSSRKPFSNIEKTERLYIDYDKNICKINGKIETHTSDIFQSSYNLVLLAANTGGTVSGYANARIYSCKIYDNDTLIRDYIPVKDASGVACLYDKVSQTYFYNAGTGVFTAGAELPKESTKEIIEVKRTYTDWQEHNLPWISEINRIRANYNALVRLFLVRLGLPVLAESNYLDWQEVNDWERMAAVSKQMFENMEQEYRYCGVEESGGDRLL